MAIFSFVEKNIYLLFSVMLLAFFAATTSAAESMPPRLLWVGEESTGIGVSRTDGRPGVYIQTQSLDDVAADNSRGVVWLGTRTAVMQYRQDGTEIFRHLINVSIPSSSSTAASVSSAVVTTQNTINSRVRLSLDPSDGLVWIGSGRELLKLSYDNQEIFRIGGFGGITGVSVDVSDGSCWVAEAHKITKYAPDGTALFSVPAGESISITALAADPGSHALWVGTEEGLGKIDALGQELFRTGDIAGIRDMEVNMATGSLWIVTVNEVHKYSKDNQKLLTVPLCPSSQQNNVSATATVSSGTVNRQTAQSSTCSAEFTAIAVDSVDNTVWAATKDTLFKGSDAGDLLLQVPGYINIRALDIGLPKIGITITEPVDGAVFEASPITVRGTITDPTATVEVNGVQATVTNLDFEAAGVALASGNNIITATATNRARQKATDTVHITHNTPDSGALLVCPEAYLEQQPHPPVAGCAQQVPLGHVHYERGYILGRVNDTDATVVVDGIPLISGGYIYNRGRILQAGWTDTFFWARMRLSGPDGPYPVTVTMTPEQGSQTAATVTFIKDTIAPNIAITSPPDGIVTNSPTITVTGTVDDPAAVVQLDSDGANIPVTNGTFSFPYNMRPGEGIQYIGVSATDPALNRSSVVISVIRDTTPPQISITAPGEGTVTNSQTVNIAGTIIDQNLGTATVTVNTGAAQPLTMSGSGFTGTAALTNGINALLFTATDRAGNNSTLSRTVILDQEPPTATVTGITANAVLTGTATITVTASDILSGIRSVALIVDGVIGTTLTQGPYTFSLETFTLTPGNHTVTIRITDGAGNVTEQNFAVTVQHQFGIQIVSPPTRTTINKSTALIRGTINYPANQEIGVAVNGVPAEQQGNTFAAIVPLQQGPNTITATATNLYGIHEQATITINTESIQEQVRFTANPASGIMTTKADGTTSFETTMAIETAITGTIVNYSYDTNGDGIAEQQGATLTQITASYRTPGLYFPTITVTDTLGNTYTDTGIVNVLDRNTVDALLKAKWEGMKGAVLAGSIETALNYFIDTSKDRYRTIFNQIGGEGLTAIFSAFTDLITASVGTIDAQYEAIRQENGSASAYAVLFVKDRNGLWKIRAF